MLQSSALHQRLYYVCSEGVVFGKRSTVWIGNENGWTLQGMAPVVRLQCRSDTGMSECLFVGKRVRRTLGRRAPHMPPLRRMEQGQ